MILFNNGIVIQAIGKERIEFTRQANFTDAEFENLRAYQGIGRYYLSWPLSIEEDNFSKQLTAEAEKWFITHYPDETVSYNLEVIPEKKFCIEYINHCKKKGIKIRILFCRTEIEKPIWNSVLPQQIFLGYDYATPVDFNSTIPEDLLDPIITYLEYPVYKELVQCRDKLNSNKLFKNEDDIVDYIEKRKKVMESDIQFEYIKGYENPARLVDDSDDFIIFHLSEVIGEL